MPTYYHSSLSHIGHQLINSSRNAPLSLISQSLYPIQEYVLARTLPGLPAKYVQRCYVPHADNCDNNPQVHKCIFLHAFYDPILFIAFGLRV